jgi:hypothetical protein
VVVAEQHRPVERYRQHQPDELLGGQGGVVDRQAALLSQAGHDRSEGGDGPGQAPVVEGAAQGGEAGRLPDHYPPQPQDPGVHDAVKQQPGVGA